MTSSHINFIRPQVLNDDQISSWFSLRNHETLHKQNRIPGLNLGLNTDEEKEIVLNNRKLLGNEIGVKENQIAYASQVHKTHVEIVEKAGIYPDTDAMVTRVTDLALAIQVADCVAVLLGDPVNRIIGAVHAGWRGAANDIIPKTIAKMLTLGAETKQIYGFLGPCISLGSFEVGEEVATQFPNEYVDREHYNKPHIDLKAFINFQLLNEGMLDSKIELDTHCTINDERFYSYRRQKEKSGRMMGIIKLKPS
jgi:YfiH family protein